MFQEMFHTHLFDLSSIVMEFTQFNSVCFKNHIHRQMRHFPASRYGHFSCTKMKKNNLDKSTFKTANLWHVGNQLFFSWQNLQMIWVFPKKTWHPQIMNFNRVFHSKPSILGYPLFLETPISIVNLQNPEIGASFPVSKTLLPRSEGFNGWCSERSNLGHATVVCQYLLKWLDPTHFEMYFYIPGTWNKTGCF